MEAKGKYSYELIEDYLEGLLDDNSSKRISKLLNEDETARTIAKGILTLKQQYNEKEIENYLDRIYNNHLETIRQASQQKKSLILWKVAAAIVLLAISSIVIFQSTKPGLNDYLNNELDQLYVISQNLRSTTDPNDNLMLGLIAYSDGDYQYATHLLRDDESPQGVFARGLCHLYLGNYQQAAKDFQKEHLQDSRYSEQSKWYLALTYLKANDKTNAINTLESIVKNADHYKGQEAKQLQDLLAE